MASYHYLGATLPDLQLDRPMREPRTSTKELFVWCMEELSPRDFDQVRLLYLFNDIKNVVFFHFNQKTRAEDYQSPSYYDEATFFALRDDPLDFLPFLARFYELKAAGERVWPDLPETDEVTALFYHDLDNLAPCPFLTDYLTFLCDLRNVASAITYRRSGLPVAAKLLPWGGAWERIVEHEQDPDFGLGDDWPFAEELVGAAADGRLRFELAVEEVVWDWLDDRAGTDLFSLDAILAHFVRLGSCERWETLREEQGKEALEGILGTVQRSIRFSVEFNKTGDR